MHGNSKNNFSPKKDNSNYNFNFNYNYTPAPQMLHKFNENQGNNKQKAIPQRKYNRQIDARLSPLPNSRGVKKLFAQNLSKPGSSRPQVANSQSQSHLFRPDELCGLVFNQNDDPNTLIQKNAKLRNLIVQASRKIEELSAKYSQLEEDSRREKNEILEDLDKITINYRTYAESYKNLQILEEQFQTLQREYEYKYQILVSYQESLSLFLKDYVILYKLIESFLNDGSYSNSVQFISELKNIVMSNMNMYKQNIDNLNVRDECSLNINLNLSDHSPSLVPVAALPHSKSSQNMSKNKTITNNSKNSLQRVPSTDDVLSKNNKSTRSNEYLESKMKNFWDEGNPKNVSSLMSTPIFKYN